ncbi:MAG TPA: hypothetical protein VGM88_07280 [Kofleriaceae bacterium]|jgi:hypothetical protein
MRALLIVAALFAAVPAFADPPNRIVVAVGQSEQRDVGLARGTMCDDPSIVRAELKTVSMKSNVLTLTGLAEGKTHCRAGTAAGRPSFVFEVVVTSAKTETAPPPDGAP